ncbi:MAG: urocanate hydratase [Candidatus Eremiobacterota bacterium]
MKSDTYKSLTEGPVPFGKPDDWYMERLPLKAPEGPAFYINKYGYVGAELAARNFLNNLDPDVAEKRSSRVVYGGKGRAARTAFDAMDMLYHLSELKKGETLQVQSGAVSAVLRFGMRNAVQIANSNLIGSHDTQAHEEYLEKLGLMMYGQYTAGSWIYIGTQGILQGTYVTFLEAIKKVKDKIGKRLPKILTAGCGAMSGAQGVAGTLAESVIIVVEPRLEALQKRVRFAQLDTIAGDLDEALAMADKSSEEKKPLSIGLAGNAGTVYPELLKRGWIPDIVTEQTCAHDRLKYLPHTISVEEADALSGGSDEDRKKYVCLSSETLKIHIEAMIKFQDMGAYVFDYGTGARRWATELGVDVKNADGSYKYPGFVEDLIRGGYFAEGSGPFRFIAYNGQEALHAFEDALIKEFNEERHKSFQIWMKKARTLKPQGTASRICWLDYRDRARAAEIMHKLVPKHGYIGIGRDHLDVGGAASLERCTEGLPGGAIADWVMLGAMGVSAMGADVVSIHGGGGTGMGNSRTYGYTIFLDGSENSLTMVKNVLLFDPAQGIGRLHAEDVKETYGPVSEINKAGYMTIPPCRNRAGLVT